MDQATKDKWAGYWTTFKAWAVEHPTVAAWVEGIVVGFILGKVF